MDATITDPIAISALQHWSYCPRQAALIHLDGVWSDNPFTMRGHILHERADQAGSDLRGDIRVERALPLFCRRLNLSGRADAVELHPGGRLVPVEYKSGRRKARAADDLQLCAQALCLEEMLGRPVAEGATFHAPDRRRRPVAFTDALRATVERTVADIASMLASRALPPAVHDARCEDCSLLRLCLPGLPALALDLMEEFRSLMADRVAFALINRRQLQPSDFTRREGGAVELSEHARKEVLATYQRRKQDELAHPLLAEPMPPGLGATVAGTPKSC